MVQILIEVIGCFIAIFSFGFIIHIPNRYLLRAGVIGAIAGMIYLICVEMGMNIVLSNFISAFIISIICHLCARMFKTPVTLFLVAGILPTVPGAGMYSTVYYFLEADQKMASAYLVQTLEVAGVIALAIFIVDTIFKAFQRGECKQNSMNYINVDVEEI